ncbi:MAG TPA: hypothetical protein VKE40_27825 [Gemmataceae bacterium]|nr:hypothetical protein [Gemmataceae bacterium]
MSGLPAVDRVRVPGVLLLHEDPLVQDATTVREHVGAFGRHSRFAWYPFNVAFGLPPALARYEFAVCVFHYSLRPTYHWLTNLLREYLLACPGTYKVAIFQDEYWYFWEREQFLTEFRIDCLYSRHKPQHVREVYAPRLPIKKFVHYLSGYVTEDLVARVTRLARPYVDRPIDVGYRGRRLPHYAGRGGQEKGEIAEQFLARAGGRGLRLDVAVGEGDRLYGADWDRFLADCRAVLGVEGGVSVVDPCGRFKAEYERLIRQDPGLTFEDYAARMGPEFQALEDRIDYRSLSPRHFESAAFRNLQILYEGRYDGILEPWVHYVPLRKDFGNLDEVLAVLADPARATAIIDRTYADLIASGKYSYQRFVRSFDEELIAAGIRPEIRPDPILDARLRGYFASRARFQSRMFDFDRAAHRILTSSPARERRVLNARELLADYRQVVDRRSPDGWSPRAGWVEQARDRYFWRQVERALGERVPARAEFDARPRHLTADEWLVAAPGGIARGLRQAWSTIARKARGAVQRIGRLRGRSA